MTNSSSSLVRLVTVGDARIETEKGSVDPSATVAFAVALYLLLEAPQPISRSALAEMMWPRASMDTRMHRLRQTLLKLRRLGFTFDSVGKSSVRVANEIILEHDELAKDAEKPLSHRKSFSPLADFYPAISHKYEEWLDQKKTQITSVLVGRLLSEIAKRRHSGEWLAVEAFATSLLHINPLNEEATLALAESLAMRGSKNSATELLDRYIQDTGHTPSDLGVQARLMRRRIGEKLPPRAAAASREPALVGRRSILAELAKLLATVKADGGQSFLFVGDAGIGKSRLLEEFARFASLQGFAYLRIECRSSSINRPLSAFVELVSQLQSLPGAIGCSPETLHFLDRLTRHEPDSDQVAVNIGDPAWILGRIQRAIFDLVDAVAHETPLLIHVEDVHWLDTASADLLREIIDRTPSRVLFGLTGREIHDEWKLTSPKRLHITRLEPITDDESAELAMNIARQHGKHMRPTYVEWCVRVAEGNPYFLTELATYWVETGLEGDVPPSLSAVLNNRLARIDQQSLHVLQTCALLENNCTMSRIEAVLQYEAFQLLASMDILGSAGMIVIDSRDGLQSDRIASKHELLSSAALLQLSAPARRFLHRRIGQVLENEIGDHYSAAALWDCAKHWQFAGDATRAFQLVTSCAAYLMNVGLPLEAASAYEKSLPFCTSDDQRLEILRAQTKAYYRMSAWSNVLESCAKVRSLQKRLSPSVSHHDDIELMDFRAQWQTFDWHSVLLRATNCLYSSEASLEHRVEAGIMALMLSGMQCDHEGGTRIYESIEELNVDGAIPESTMLKAKMVYHVDHGDIDVGVDAALQFVEGQRSRGDIGELFRGLLNAAMACRVAGRFSESEKLYRSGLDLTRNHGFTFAEQLVLPIFAHLLLELGRTEHAKELYERLLTIPMATYDNVRYIQQQAIGVRLALCEGRTEDAVRQIPFSLSDIASEPMYGKRTYNLALLVAVELAEKGCAARDSIRCLEESFAIAQRTQHQAFSAFVLYVALCQRGEPDRATRILTDYERKFRREPWPAPQHLLETIKRSLPNVASKKGKAS